MTHKLGSTILISSLAAVVFGSVLLEPGLAVIAQPAPTRTPEPPLPTWSPPLTPTPESTHPSSEAARRMIEQSDQAMNRQRSLTVNGSKFATREMEGTPHGLFTDQFAFPDRFKQVHRSSPSSAPSMEIVIIGRHHWYRSVRAEWLHDLHSQPFQWPSYPGTKTWEWGAPARPIDLRLEGPVDAGGRPCWQISYEIEAPSIEGPYRIHSVEWIDTDSSLFRQRLYQADDPWGDRSWVLEAYDYASPVNIEPPLPQFRALLPEVWLNR